MFQNKRSYTRVSCGQQELMLDFMQNHSEFAFGHFCGPLGKGKEENLWKLLTSILNSEGKGAQKDEKHWKKTWTDWKNNTKDKASKLKTHSMKTGGGEKAPSELSPIELRLLDFCGWQLVTGITTVAEAGMGAQPPETSTIPLNNTSTATSATGNNTTICQDAADIITYDLNDITFMGDFSLADVEVQQDSTEFPPVASSSSVKRNTNENNPRKDKKRKIDEKKMATNPVVAAAEQFSKIEENRIIFYGQVTESLQKISAAAEEIANAETRKAAALERLADIIAAKYANLL